MTEPPRPHAEAPAAMRPADAVMWNIEVDPVLRSTVVAVAVLDRSPDWEVLTARLQEAIALLPRLRQRVDPARLPVGVPAWVDDEAFDLDYHLRRVRVPEPGTLRAVLDLAAPMAMDAFDPARPLWEFTLVEGLEDGGAALIQKFHHSIMDGEGAIALERRLLDGAPRAVTPPAAVPAGDASSLAAEPGPDRLVGLAALGRQGWSMGSRALRFPAVVATTSWGAITQPATTLRTSARLARSIAKALAPVPETESTMLQARGLSRRLETIDLLLEDLRAAGHACGGTVNDAFLAGVVGGLAEYHRRHDAPVDTLHVTMPVSIRSKGDGLEGNRFAPVRFAVPAGITDPAARVRQLGEIAHDWQHEPFLQHTDALATVLAWLPAEVAANVFGGMLKHVDAVATNVAGLTEPAVLAGATIVREYAFAPPMGAALNISLLSHGDRACVGVVLDAAAVPDVECFKASLVAGFDEVVAVADHHARRTA